MTEINNPKFYQFLTTYQKDGQTWINAADTNGDGCVIKAEFRTFMKDNFDWNGETNDTERNNIINEYWRKMDTMISGKVAGTKLKDLNALNKQEVENLDKKIDAYVQFDQFIADNVEIPKVLTNTGSRWKSDVIDGLTPIVEDFCKDYKGDLDALLLEALPAIANTNTAIYCNVEYQETLKSTILAPYSNYKEDATLDSIIKNYIASVGADVTAETIKSDIKAIVDEYFATAGLCDGSGYDLSQYGYKGDSLNEIQKEVIKESIKKDLAEEAKNYEKYDDEFDEAVQKFIDSKIQEGGDFETLKACAAEFMDSKFKTDLDNFITIETTYKKVEKSEDPNSFYQKIVAECGKTVADKIAQNARYILEDILNEVQNKVLAGEMEMSEVEAYILKQISDNLTKFFKNGLGEMSIEELNSTYNKLAEKAENTENTDEAEAKHREAALLYVNALASKSDTLKAAVVEAFGGDDYISKINKDLYPGEIFEIIQKLQATALELGDATQITMNESSWSGIAGGSVTISTGKNKDFEIKPTFTKPDGSAQTITSDRIKYSATSIPAGLVIVDKDTGKVTIDGTKASEGNYSGTVKVIVDGVVVATKEVEVKVFKQMNLAEETASTSQGTFKEIINNHKKVIKLSGWNGDTDDFKRVCKSGIKSFIKEIVEVLKKDPRYDEAILNKTAQTLNNYYSAIIDKIALTSASSTSNYHMNNISFNYVDANGATHTDTTSFFEKKYSREGSADGSEQAQVMGADTSGIQYCLSYKSHDTRAMYINTAVIMEKFQQFYNSMI